MGRPAFLRPRRVSETRRIAPAGKQPGFPAANSVTPIFQRPEPCPPPLRRAALLAARADRAAGKDAKSERQPRVQGNLHGRKRPRAVCACQRKKIASAFHSGSNLCVCGIYRRSGRPFGKAALPRAFRFRPPDLPTAGAGAAPNPRRSSPRWAGAWCAPRRGG